MRKILFLLLTMMMMVSCSQHRKLAYKFVDDSANASVALFLPESLIKKNLRNDSVPEEMDTLSLQEKIAFLESQTKIVDKIDDALFLDILYLSMASTLNDYGLNVVTSIDDSTSAWLIDIPRVEVSEMNVSQPYYYSFYNEDCVTFVPIDVVNVAAWFVIGDNADTPIYFTEQNLYSDYSCSFQCDKQGRLLAKYYVDSLTVSDFYRFAENLGRLYAGYCYDAALNDYIKRHSEKSPDSVRTFRYDPYEQLLFRTDYDHLVPVF